MALPAPHLDDRRFQDLVDDAKRLVQQRCPEWTDHNVSDPGVTLIETFAYMVDQVLYRLNRVPDRHYVRFLELIGVRLFPPTAARVDVTFRLSAPQDQTVAIPAGTEVATRRTETEDAIAFTVVEDLAIVPCSLAELASTIVDDEVRDHSSALEKQEPFYCFDEVPKPGDALLLGLSDPVPSCTVLLRFACDIKGHGVNPRNPPWMWEAWDGERWVACELAEDGTGGLNRPGDVIVHIPRTHTASVISMRRAGWLRCRVVEAAERQPAYSASPRITSVTACTIGGTATAVHAEIVKDEDLGVSDGAPGQRFPLQRRPVVPSDERPPLLVSDGDGWQEWTRVDSFADSGPDDRHFMVDETEGTVVLGPAVREPDGKPRHYGARPEKGTRLRLASYRTGGGRHGNVAAGAIEVLKSSISYVSEVRNRRPAVGGVDGEDIQSAKTRAPLLLRSRDRAVTTEDYELLTRQAAPEVARVHCVPAGDGAEAGAVRVLVVPAAGDDENGALRFEDLDLPRPTRDRVAAYLDERRLIGARVHVGPPRYQGVTVVARLRARRRVSPTRLERAAIQALNRYFHPLRGGPEGDGWPFGRPVHVGEVYAVLQRLDGTEFVEEASLYGANLETGERTRDPVERLELEANALVFSYLHRVRVEA